jgi:hypothetical protein
MQLCQHRVFASLTAGAGWLLSRSGIIPALIADVQALLSNSRHFSIREKPTGGGVRISAMRPGDDILL